MVVSPPTQVWGAALSRELSFRIEAVGLPGRIINPVSMSTYGPVYNIGGQANYIETQFQAILSPDFRERDMFMRWQDIISGSSRSAFGNADQRKSMFNVGYYDDYVGKAQIRQYINTEPEVPIYILDLVEAWPIRVEPNEVSWSNDQPARLGVSLMYRYFTESYRSVGEQAGRGPDGLLTQLNRSGVSGAVSTAVGQVLTRL